MTEIFKPIPEYPGYEASNLGRIRSQHRASKPNHILSHELQHRGYHRVTLRVGNKTVKRRVHRLVLMAHVGPCPEGYECSHLDGCRLNNRLDNLKWVSQLENDREKEKHGTSNRKVTAEQVLEIRERAKTENCNRIAKDYPISQKTVSDIVQRKHWKHI